MPASTVSTRSAEPRLAKRKNRSKLFGGERRTGALLRVVDETFLRESYHPPIQFLQMRRVTS